MTERFLFIVFVSLVTFVFTMHAFHALDLLEFLDSIREYVDPCTRTASFFPEESGGRLNGEGWEKDK